MAARRLPPAVYLAAGLVSGALTHVDRAPALALLLLLAFYLPVLLSIGPMRAHRAAVAAGMAAAAAAGVLLAGRARSAPCEAGRAAGPVEVAGRVEAVTRGGSLLLRAERGFGRGCTAHVRVVGGTTREAEPAGVGAAVVVRGTWRAAAEAGRAGT
ncbi:MAG: hypothetical protein D6701_06825, partial [Gemmatimonadetes bacterium]